MWYLPYLTGDRRVAGSRGPTGKRGAVRPGGPPGKIGKIGPPGPIGNKGSVGDKGDVRARGEKVEKGDVGGIGSVGPRGSTGLRGVRGVEGVRGDAGPDGPIGPACEKGDRGPPGPYGTQGLVGERGERGERGEKGLQGDTSDVLSVLAAHLPIQLAERYSEKMCFIKYHVSEDKSSVVESSGGVQTLHNVSAYHEPVWHFDAAYVDRQEHNRATAQSAPGHRNVLEMNNSAYHCPYDLADNKVNTIYIVYKIRGYDSTGTEHDYHFSCGMGDNHRGICFLEDEKTMRVYGVAGTAYMDISSFPTSYFNPCRKDKWNVVCVVSGKSSLWVNHEKIRDFTCRLPLRPSTLNLFNRVVHFDDATGFDGYIESVEMYNYYKSILTGLIAARMIIDPAIELGSFASRRRRERS